MNKKFLYRDKSYLYAKQNRLSAFDFAELSKQAYDSIVKETDYYNTKLANGKWKNMMSMQPRELPVYGPPVLPEISIDKSAVWSIAPEGGIKEDSSGEIASDLFLPHFNAWDDQKYFIDLFLNDDRVVRWTASTSASWITLSEQSGTLSTQFGKKQQRIQVSIDWKKVPGNKMSEGRIIFKGSDKEIPVRVMANNVMAAELKNFNGFIESNGYVSIYASNYSRLIPAGEARWQVIEGLGNTGNAIEALPLYEEKGNNVPKQISTENAACVEYNFYTFSPTTADVSVFTVPTHPINNKYSMRYGVAIDDSPVQILDFKTVGRSEEWKQNVLRNNAVRKWQSPFLKKGRHRLKIYRIDPGVIVDKITIDLGGLKKSYGTIKQTTGKGIVSFKK
jgi:hypothetical protein